MTFHHTLTKTLVILAILAFSFAGATASGLVPARSDIFFPIANPCAKAGVYCDDQLTCPGSPHGTCEGPQSCARAEYPLTNGSKLRYCACAQGGPVVDPRDQPSWECTAVAKVDPVGNPVGMRCYNGVECPPGQVCTKLKDANTGCESCDCK